MAKLFIGGLAWHTNDRTLFEEFSRYGQVVEATVIRDRDTDRSRGFGFVTFETQEQADVARQTLDNADFDGRRIRVSQAADRRGGRGGSGSGFGSRGGPQGSSTGGSGVGRGGFYAPPGGTWRDTREPPTQSYQQSTDLDTTQEQGYRGSAGYSYDQPPQAGRYTEAGGPGRDLGGADTRRMNRQYREPGGPGDNQRYDQRNGYGQGQDGNDPSQW